MVFHECVFVSSLDVFLQLFVCNTVLKGEDMGCATPDSIQRDLEDWAASTRAPVHANMDYDDVMPASHVLRRDACEWNYFAQCADRGSIEPASGRPLWDIT